MSQAPLSQADLVILIDTVRVLVETNDFIASVVGQFDRQGSISPRQESALQKFAQRINVPKAGPGAFIGEVGVRQQFTGTVEFKKYLETYGYAGNGAFPASDVWLVKLITDAGETIVYIGSGALADSKVGERVTFSASVAEHSERQGVKNTKVKRPTKIQRLAAVAKAA